MARPDRGLGRRALPRDNFALAARALCLFWTGAIDRALSIYEVLTAHDAGPYGEVRHDTAADVVAARQLLAE